ncbi:lactoylglutathione lyase [Geothermobacter hydrogeniphilus]|uniref:Aldoketomutase n=1 Tax=Geothermobacter hydrogeniphilus TaxID=1969733 RepID=A0A2K2H5T5_9BACT|nr:VOC family protein [Geothermobacter hydrogeniphilus]PNU18583.1 lactoylglutathione lyase [Geothermobacter hydrogeniphilus]
MTYRMIHACIRVLDLEKSEQFYQQAFGFRVSRKRDFPDDGFTLSYLTDPSDSFELELTYNYDQQEPYVIGNGYSHLAVSVDDLEASHRRHQELGLDPTPLKGLSGTASFYFVSDPDGYRVEVVRMA